MSLLAGTQIGRYRVTARLGGGGMGEVYRARDTTLDRDVALKVVTPAGAANESTIRRFLREAQAASAAKGFGSTFRATSRLSFVSRAR